MKRTGKPRRDLLVRMCPRGPQPIIDVGADHGHVAKELGCIATERLPNRVGRPDIPWVISDGLTAFRTVGVAIIAGMGARTIATILDNGPRPEWVVLHAQDDPNLLRQYLAQNHWTIVQEGLAPEAKAFAQVIVAKGGQEKSTGLELEYGPILLNGNDPHLGEHLAERIQHLQRIAKATQHTDERVFVAMNARIHFLQTRLESYLDRSIT